MLWTHLGQFMLPPFITQLVVYLLLSIFSSFYLSFVSLIFRKDWKNSINWFPFKILSPNGMTLLSPDATIGAVTLPLCQCSNDMGEGQMCLCWWTNLLIFRLTLDQIPTASHCSNYKDQCLDYLLRKNAAAWPPLVVLLTAYVAHRVYLLCCCSVFSALHSRCPESFPLYPKTNGCRIPGLSLCALC